MMLETVQLKSGFVDVEYDLFILLFGLLFVQIWSINCWIFSTLLSLNIIDAALDAAGVCQ